MANANLYIQAWREQKGLATFFSSQRGKLGKILTGLVDKAYGGFTVVHEGDLTSGRSFFYNVYLSCLDTTLALVGGVGGVGVPGAVVGVGAGLVLLRLSRVICWQYFLSLLATVRGGTSFLCPTATKKRSKENASPQSAS